MNFLAATLLIFMEEEHAFWMLAYMVEELLHNYYIPGFLINWHFTRKHKLMIG
jgi:hypothetical protein